MLFLKHIQFIKIHTPQAKQWQTQDGSEGRKVPIGRGERAVFVHAGGEDGFVEGAELVFKGKTEATDYHSGKIISTHLPPN